MENQLHVGYGTLMGALHQLAGACEPVIERLVREYRRAPVKHADETGWRTDGHNGYAWLFCTETISLFRFRGSRSGQVAQAVLGVRRRRDVLVVDRYHAYNCAPCALQYCYAHLLRDVEDLEKEFPNPPEIQRFVGALAPLLARAMHLRGLKLSAAQFRQRAVSPLSRKAGSRWWATPRDRWTRLPDKESAWGFNKPSLLPMPWMPGKSKHTKLPTSGSCAGRAGWRSCSC